MATTLISERLSKDTGQRTKILEPQCKPWMRSLITA
jgi:hypothetical protein